MWQELRPISAWNFTIVFARRFFFQQIPQHHIYFMNLMSSPDTQRCIQLYYSPKHRADISRIWSMIPRSHLLRIAAIVAMRFIINNRAPSFRGAQRAKPKLGHHTTTDQLKAPHQDFCCVATNTLCLTRPDEASDMLMFVVSQIHADVAEVYTEELGFLVYYSIRRPHADGYGARQLAKRKHYYYHCHFKWAPRCGIEICVYNFWVGS